MNFEDESYVKVYKRQTLGMKLSGWDGRAVLRAVFMHVDRAGVLDLDGLSPAEAIAALEDMPLEIAESGMSKLLARGTVAVHENVLFIPNFIPGQEAKQSDAQRQRESRAARAAKLRAYKLGLPVTNRDEPSGPGDAEPPQVTQPASGGSLPTEQTVTNRDQTSRQQSHGVTERSGNPVVGHSQISSAQQRSDQGDPSSQRPDRLEAAGAAEDDERVPCPGDLELQPAQRDNLKIGMGASDHQLDVLTKKFRIRYVGDEKDRRTLRAWLKCLGMAVTQHMSDPKHRPPRSPDEPENDSQTRLRVRTGPRQPNQQHDTDEALLKTVGGRLE